MIESRRYDRSIYTHASMDFVMLRMPEGLAALPKLLVNLAFQVQAAGIMKTRELAANVSRKRCSALAP